MNMEAARDIIGATSPPMQARPVAFDGLLGWFTPGLTRRGVILCGTLGFEQLSAYRAWRALADEVAATGCSCLRFDYPGEGDSADAGAGRVASLVTSVRRAIRFLRDEAGIDEIVLVGLRFGGMLAALAARDGGVDRLVLLSPFANGRAYLREMQMQARTILVWPGGIPLRSKPGTINVHGFILDQDMIDDINRIDDQVYARANVPDLLIVDRTPSKILSTSMMPGIDIRQQTFAGFGSLLSGEMNFRSVTDVVATFRDLNRSIAEFSAHGACLEPALSHPKIATPRVAGQDWEEETVFFGDGLFGILCRATRPCPEKGSVLFLNSGSYVRSGPGRFTARTARNLAAQGIDSLRFDLRGTGDSVGRPDESSPFYNLDVLGDVTQAIDRLKRDRDGPLTVIGFCSGAYLAFHAACRDDRVTDTVLANLYCFDWPATVRFETIVGRPTMRSSATYARSLLHGNTWRRIVKGEIAVTTIAVGLIKLQLKTLAGLSSRILHLHYGKLRALDRVARVRRRGGRFVFAYSADDPALLNITSELGLPVHRFERAVGSRMEILADCDHNFSTPESQRVIDSIIFDVIDRRRGNGASN